jgi:glycosyltransferase involved in cell wall biosynthesis
LCNITSDRKKIREFLGKKAVEYLSNDMKRSSVLQLSFVPGWCLFWQLLWLRIRGVKTILALTIMPEPVGGPLSQFRERLGTGLRIRAFSRILSLSSEMGRSYAKRYWLLERHFTVIPNGVELERFFPVDEEQKMKLRNLHDIPEEAKVVLFLGSLVKRKRLDLLVEAWSAVLRTHPSAILLVVGAEIDRITCDEGPQKNEYRRNLENVIRKMEEFRKKHQVVLLDATEQPEQFYQLSDLFVLSSELEGLPNVLLEAMACGLPSLISNFKGKPNDGEEIGNEGEHYLQCVTDPDEWGEAIVNALSDAAEMQRVGASARKFIEREHALDKVIRSQVDFYRRAAGLSGWESQEEKETLT